MRFYRKQSGCAASDQVIHITCLQHVEDRYLLKEVIGLARSRGIFVVVDPKGRDFRKYRGANALTPNRHETEVACGFSLEGEARLQEAMEVLLEQTDADGLLITLGKEGMAVRAGYPGPQGFWRIPSEAREVYDVTGAGDTVVSAFTLAFLVCGSWEQAARLANTAAGIVVGRVGTATVQRQELLAHLQAAQRERRSRARTASPFPQKPSKRFL